MMWGMDTITEVSLELVQKLRESLLAKMIENGGGVIPQSHRSTASAIGIAQPTLSRFLDGTYDVLEPATCIRIAKYLGVPVVDVLRMGGHGELAHILVETATIKEAQVEHDPWVIQFAKAVAGLDSEGKDIVLKNAKSIARVLRDANNKKPTIIGGEEEHEEKPKATAKTKPYHYTKKRKTS